MRNYIILWNWENIFFRKNDLENPVKEAEKTSISLTLTGVRLECNTHWRAKTKLSNVVPHRKKVKNVIEKKKMKFYSKICKKFSFLCNIM